ncbi:MAG: FAD-dependent oxidoreductase [Candidatus Bathyarchaeia archaeon]
MAIEVPIEDVVIIGAGPAGFSAGIYALRRGLRVLILEAKYPGGRLVEAPLVENYAGFPEGIRGVELARRMMAQFKRFGGRVNINEEVIALDLKNQVKTVVTRKAKYVARAVIIAIGAQRRKLTIPGEDEYLGRGVSYCALCDGPLFTGQDVAVIGSGDEAFQDALFLAETASKVFLVVNSVATEANDALVSRLKNMENVSILRGYQAVRIGGDKFVRNLLLRRLTEGEEKLLPVQGIFVALGTVPITQLLKNAGVALDEYGWIKVDRKQRTNLKEVYAAGDCTGGGMQVATAVGEGAMAGIWVLRES